MSKLHWGLTGLMVLLLSACAHEQPSTTTEDANPESASAEPTVQIKETEAPSETVETNVEKPYQSPMGDIALDDNEQVEKWVHYFQGKGRKYMNLYLSRSGRYLPMMKNVLRENGIRKILFIYP